MQNTFLTMIAVLALLLGALLIGAVGDAQAKQLVLFGFDISDSGPLTGTKNIARDAGKTVQKIVSDLEPGDDVWLRSIGFAGAAEAQIKIDVTLGRKARSRPDRIAPALGKLVASFPDRVARGELQVQTRTNIIGFLEALAPSLNCQRVDTRIVLFTDGIEWSTQVKGSDLLTGKTDLPAPSAKILAGCTVEMRGVGQLAKKFRTDSRWFPLLRAQWTRFFEEAGVASFKAYAAFD